MSFSPFLAILIASQPATAEPPTITSTRWDWRVCTRNSADAQLRARALSLEFESVVRRAFEECRTLLEAVDRTQSDEDIRHLQEQQTQLIRQDVEIFYWDRMTGHI